MKSSENHGKMAGVFTRNNAVCIFRLPEYLGLGHHLGHLLSPEARHWASHLHEGGGATGTVASPTRLDPGNGAVENDLLCLHLICHVALEKSATKIIHFNSN